MKAFATALVVIGIAATGSLAFAAAADAGFTKMDVNKDQRVSAAEHARAAKRMFETMDADKDGKVTAAEMDAAQEHVTGSKAKPTDMSSADKIKVIDRDRDGVLSAKEHAAGSRAMFEKTDADKDGFLTQGELTIGHARMLKPVSR